jgi:hypothetical protein
MHIRNLISRDRFSRRRRRSSIANKIPRSVNSASNDVTRRPTREQCELVPNLYRAAAAAAADDDAAVAEANVKSHYPSPRYGKIGSRF